MVKIAETIEDIRTIRNGWLKSGETIGFVPTMGYLHAGHLSLIERAKQENDHCIVSIFVNPTQFGPNEDLDSYPRDFRGDVNKAESAGADAIFYPSDEDMYRPGHQTYVIVNQVSALYEGNTRPTHFRGVTTIVCKLLNIVHAHRAYFGQKDAQQAFIITTMVAELDMDTEIVVLPTIREEDGLAMSSRNKYLNSGQRQIATTLFKTLKYGEQLFRERKLPPQDITKKLESFMDNETQVRRDYIALVSPQTFAPATESSTEILALGAMYVGSTRLIDNMLYTLE